jgi:hypothetical protein
MIYQIKVQGNVDASWSEWFEGMEIASAGASTALPHASQPVTILTGPVADQAALRGVLCKLWDLNLTLISVRRLEAAQQGTSYAKRKRL